MKIYFVISLIIVLALAACTLADDKKANEDTLIVDDAKSTGNLPKDNSEDDSDWTDLTPPEKKVEPKKPSCEDWAETMIPVNVKLYEGQTQCERSLSGIWKDGSPVKINHRKIEFINNENRNLQMMAGSEAGEKVDEFYLKSYGGDTLTFKYEKNAQGSDGTIIGVDEFEMEVDSYQRLEDSMLVAEELGCAYYEYKLMDYEFLSCTKN